MQYRLKGSIFLGLLLTIVLSGCSSKQPTPLKVYWPPPPAEPRLEWITTFASEDDFPKTESQLFSEKFLGKQRTNLFQKPTGVVADKDGLVYVADLDLGSIQVIDFKAKQVAPYAGGTPVGRPAGLTIDRHNSLYVADTHGKQVLVFNPRGELVRKIGAGELTKPTFLALDEGRNRLYVSEVTKNEVVVFDLTSGNKLFAFGGRGSGAGALHGPQGLAVDKQGQIFVAEQFNARVQVFDAEGQHKYMFGKRGDKAFMFEGPRGLALDSQENLYVVETRKAAVLIFQPDGTPLSSLGGARSGHVLGFVLPSAIFIDANDRIYISDGMNRRITIWQFLTPAYLAEHPMDSESLQKIEERVLQIQKSKD